MKVRELLLESVTLSAVLSDNELIDPKTDKYYTEVVNVTGNVLIEKEKLEKIPVKFGKVGGAFFCHGNKLTSFEGAPYQAFSYNFMDNKLTSLEGIHKIIKKAELYINITGNPIKSGGIGLLLIEGLTVIDTGGRELPAFKIIEKYLGQGKRGLLACQEELIEAGLEEYAKL